jgi:ABC-type lipoprotein export system ATPase subunit
MHEPSETLHVVLVLAAEDMRRVSIGVGLVQQPGALIVDGPTGGLSHSAGNRIMRTLKVWLQAGGRPTACRPPCLMLPLKCPPLTVPAAAS